MKQAQKREKKGKGNKGKEQGRANRSGALSPDKPVRWTAALCFGAVLGLIFLAFQCFHLPKVMLDGESFFLDPDSYAWMDRAQRVIEEPGIFVHNDPLDNFPTGYSSHWTQPFHWGLALFSRIFHIAGDKNPLETAGVWICPLLGLLTAGLLSAWAFRRWPWQAALLAGFVFLANPFEQWTFSLGRPDHQCLLVPLLLGSLLLMLRRADTPWYTAIKQNALSGILMAAAVWVSVQALSLWALIAGILVLHAALAAEPEKRSRRLHEALAWSGAAFSAAFLFLLIERKGNIAFAAFDSISICHVVLLAMPAIGLFAAKKVLSRRKALGCRSWLFSAILLPLLPASAAGMLLWYLQRSGMGTEVTAATSRWFEMNLEFQPAIFAVNGKLALGRFHEAFGYSFYTLPFLIYGVVVTRMLDSRAKLLLVTGVVVSALLTIWQLRWRDLYSLFIIPVMAAGIWELVSRSKIAASNNMIGSGRGIGRIVPPAASVTAAAIVLVPWLSCTWQSIKGFPDHEPPGDYQAVREICTWIRENDPYIPDDVTPQAVLAAWDFGPMVKHWSGRPVIAGPYHGNMEGVLDTMTAYSARDPGVFESISKKRRIRYVLRTPNTDPYHDLYSFEYIRGAEHPAMYVKTEQITEDGKGITRGFDLNRGMTPEKIDDILCLRLVKNQWTGWSGLQPVMIPGLERMLPDATRMPYLYRCVFSHSP